MRVMDSAVQEVKRPEISSLSVIIVSYNTQALLRDCLQSIAEAGLGDAEVIVVDNGSTDGSAGMVCDHFPLVQLIETRWNLGFAGANNIGIAASQGEHILLLNSDTIIRRGVLKTMSSFLDAHPSTGAVGCRLENPDGSLQPSCYRFPSPGRAFAESFLLTAAFPNHPVVGDYRAWPHNTARNVDFVIGAALMVRRAVIDEIGPLDEGFFLYSEETDWCRRMYNANWHVTFLPSVTVIHHGGQSSAGIKDRQFCETSRSADRYIRKHHGPIGLILFRAAMLLGSLMRLTLWGIASLVSPRRRASIQPTLTLWGRILRWHLGLGPREGIRELAAIPSVPTSEKDKVT